MTLLALMIAVFVVSLLLSISVLYFFVVVPLSKRRMMSRLEAIQKLEAAPTIDSQPQILREDVLSYSPAINRFLTRMPLMRRLHLFVKQSALETSVGQVLSFSLAAVGLALLIGRLLRLPLPLLPIVVAIAGAIPFLVVAFYRRRRFSRFEELLPDAIDLLARSVRAGHAFTAGLEMIADEMSAPLSGEFRLVYEQQNLGLPLREALQNLVLRVPLPDVRVFVTALVIQRESGGNLAEILDNLAHVVRERFKLMRQIQAVTAQGRLTRNILLAIPPAMGLYMYLINPAYILKLFTDPLGNIMLAYAVVSQIIGFFVIQKIIEPKV